MKKRSKSSQIWNYFTVNPQDESSAFCKLCPENSEKKKVSRGAKCKGSRYGTTNLKNHLKQFHSDDFKKFEVEMQRKKKKRSKILIISKKNKKICNPFLIS